MSWRDLVLLVVFIVGIVLFLYGANVFNATLGWTGIGVMLAAIVAEIAFRVYASVGQKKKKSESI